MKIEYHTSKLENSTSNCDEMFIRLPAMAEFNFLNSFLRRRTTWEKSYRFLRKYELQTKYKKYEDPKAKWY